jgi:glycerol-3-phosphate acyltransferase PlsY
MNWTWALAVAGGYLCGSIPFGLVIGWARGVDIRQHGSRNIGATNCGRVLGRPWGIACFALDLLKGAAPVLATGWTLVKTDGAAGLPSPGLSAAWLGVGAAAVVGHVAPVWLRFKGGKGVATGFGVVLGVYPYLTIPAIGAAAVWIALVAACRYVSLGSIAAAAAMPALFLAGAAWNRWPMDRCWPYLAVTSLMGALIIWRHRSNIQRLLAGTENKIGGRK